VGAKSTKNGIKYDAYVQAGAGAVALQVPVEIGLGKYDLGYVTLEPKVTLEANALGVSANAGAGYRSYLTRPGGDFYVGLGITPVFIGAKTLFSIGVVKDEQ
jgi:hypothetical protein